MGKLLYNDRCAVCDKKRIVELFDHVCKNGDILCLAYCDNCVKERIEAVCKYCQETITEDLHWYMNDRHYECDEMRIKREKEGFCIKCGIESPKRYCKKHGNSHKWVGYGKNPNKKTNSKKNNRKKITR